jgi:hypothetical protein
LLSRSGNFFHYPVLMCPPLNLISTKILYAFFVSTERVTCPACLILLCLITQIILGEKYKSLSLSLRYFPPSCCCSFYSRSNILDILLRNINITSCLLISHYWCYLSRNVSTGIRSHPVCTQPCCTRLVLSVSAKNCQTFAKLGKHVTIS